MIPSIQQSKFIGLIKQGSPILKSLSEKILEKVHSPNGKMVYENRVNSFTFLERIYLIADSFESSIEAKNLIKSKV